MRTNTDSEVNLAPGPWLGLDLLDCQLFTQLEEVAQTFAHSAVAIWASDFRPDRMPLLLVRNAGTDHAYGYALNVRCPEVLDPDAQRIELPQSLGLPPVYRFGAEAANSLGLSDKAPARFACEIGDDTEIADDTAGEQDCLAVSYDHVESDASDHEFARFLVHEAFHQYQMFEACWQVPRGYDPSTPWVLDPTDSELATREMWYLETSVQQPTGSAATVLAQRFLETRARRHARREDIVSNERGHEQTEGSARFVENLYSFLNGRSLHLPLPSANELDPREFASVGRFYRTGARVMELLDRTGVVWRHRLSEGLDPVTLLEEALAASDSLRDLEAKPASSGAAAII